MLSYTPTHALADLLTHTNLRSVCLFSCTYSYSSVGRGVRTSLWRALLLLLLLRPLLLLYAVVVLWCIAAEVYAYTQADLLLRIYVVCSTICKALRWQHTNYFCGLGWRGWVVVVLGWFCFVSCQKLV